METRSRSAKKAPGEDFATAAGAPDDRSSAHHSRAPSPAHSVASSCSSATTIRRQRLLETQLAKCEQMAEIDRKLLEEKYRLQTAAIIAMEDDEIFAAHNSPAAAAAADTTVAPNAPTRIDASHGADHDSSPPAASAGHACCSSADIGKFLARQTSIKELPTFSGEVEEWTMFYSQFVSTTQLCKYSDDENIARLVKCLRGKARDAVSALLVSASSLVKIIDTLKLRFGRADCIIETMLGRIRAMHNIRHDDFNALIEFATSVQNVEAAMRATDEIGHLTNTTLIREIVSKLPSILKYQWSFHIAERGLRHVTLTDLSEWLMKTANAATHVAPMTPRPTERPNKPWRPTVLVTTTTKAAVPSCAVSNGAHGLAKCSEFVRFTPDDRWKLVTEKKFCFSCLSPRHQLKDCRRKKKCTKCDRLHHDLLHTEPMTNSGISDAKTVGHVNRTGDSVMLKVARVVISGPGGDVETLAMLDEGANVSLIDESLAQRIGVKGAASDLRIQGVSGMMSTATASHHVTQTASWLPPVECWGGSRDGSHSSQEPEDDELPYGWEQALDSRGKPYYINHVNKTTTYVAPEGCACESPPAPRDVVLERDAELGFGFVAGSERPVLVRFVTDNSPSVGKLEPGDQILCVNGEDVSTAAREHVIAAVRACAERVTLRVCQPARAGNPARRSALLSAAKRARLRARPPRVRFADSVQLNGAPMYPPSAFSLGDLCLPPMANVLKVFLENGQTKSFKYDTTTTVAGVVTSLRDKLCIVAEEHFSLVVEHVKSVRRNKLTLLDPKESLARIAARPGSHKMRCLFRVVFMPTSAAELAQRDLAALDYLYMQCCNDVAQERFAPELQPDVALRLAALHMHQHALANNVSPAKLTVKAVEREFGLERFVPSGLLESMKRKEIRRLIAHFLKLNSQMTGSQRQLTQLQAKLHYLDIVAGLPSYGAKCFGSARPERVLLVSPRFGLSQIVSRANAVPQSIASLEEVEGVRVKRESGGSADVAVFLTRDRVVALLMDERDAIEMPLVIAGYYRLATGKELNVELEREPITEDIAPPYLSQHNVVPMKWSYLHFDDPNVLSKKHFTIFTMPPPYHSTPDQAKPGLDTNMNSSLNNKNHSNNSSPLTGYDSQPGLLGHDVHFEKCKRNEDFRLFDPNDACYLDDGMGFDLQSVLSMELLENATNNPRLVEARNEEVLRRVAEMQKLVENSEQYLTENCDVYNEDAFSNGLLRDELVGKESSVDQAESDTESNNSRMSTADDAPGILKHSDSLLLLTETINQGLSGLNVPDTEKDNNGGNMTLRQSQGLSAILNNCGLTDALLALNNDLSHSESDNDSLYTPTNSPIRRHQIKSTNNKVVRTSFGLHSPDATLDTKEPNLKKYLEQLREKSSKEEAKADFPYFCEDISVDNDAELIDLTLIPPPQTPDELDCVTQVPQILPVVPPSFADEKKNSQENLNAPPKKGGIEEFIATVTVPPPTVKVTPAIELTPEEIMSYIIPPPPGSNSSTLDREPVSYVNHSQIIEAKKQQNHKDPKPNGEVVKGTLSVSEIRNIFAAKTLSDARNSLLLKEKSKTQHTKSDSPKTKRKSITEKPANGNTHVIEYPTVERKGMFSCCRKDKNKSDDSDDSDKVDGQVEKSDSMPDVCEIRPPPRRKNPDSIKPPDRPPKTVPAPAPRPRSNSFSCPNNELTTVEIPNNHFSTLNNRKLNYKVVCEMNEQQPPPQLPPRLEYKVLSPPPPLLLPPKKPPLPPVPSIEVLRMKTSQKLSSPIRHPEQRLASIGSPHFQRNLNTYRNLENESRLTDDETHSSRSSPNYSSMTLQSRHVRSSSETKSTILKNNEMSGALSLCSPQMNRRFSNRPDLLNGAAGIERAFSPPADRRFRRDSASPVKVQNHVRFKESVVDEVPAPPPPPGAGAALGAAEAAAAALLARLHAAAQRCAHQHAHGGGEDIDEHKFQRARSELTACAVTLVGTSRTLVSALGGNAPVAPALADCLTPLRRLADLAQALCRHTSAPLQTRNLVLRVHDVTAAFKDLAGAEMAQIIHEHNNKTHSQNPDNNSTLEGQLALRAECLANVLATLLRSLRVFSP